MSVVQSIEDIGPCKKELRIEVPAPAVDAETERVTQEYGRRVRVPGFRPGKVPAPVVRKRFGEDIDKDVVERLVPRYWHQAEAESGIEPLLQPELAGIEDRAPGEPLVFTARVEVRPEIALGNITEFTLPELSPEPTDDEVESALADLRRGAGDWVPVERAAAQGDLVAVEIAELPESAEPGMAEGAEPGMADATSETVEVEVGSPRVWEELSVALAGRQEGQSGAFTRMEDEGGQVRERRFRFTVRAVKERDLPELDDELAKEIAGIETLEALRGEIRRRLTAQKTGERHSERERVLLDQLRERHPLALPEGVINAELEILMREYAENLARRGVALETAQIDWESLARQARPAAEKRVHARLLLDAVAEREGITVSQEEIELALSRIARQEGASTAAVRRALDSDGRLKSIEGQMRRAKTVHRLLGEETSPGEGDAAGETAADAPPASDVESSRT